jgi:ABC-type uncharacterized transport system auxiliary subunit
MMSACALSPAPVDRYFRLNGTPIDGGFESARLPGSLRVKRPRTDSLTDGTHLLFRRHDAPGEVFREPYQYWTDAPSLIVRDLLLEALAKAKLAERVLAPNLRTSSDYTLASRLMKFERLIETVGQRVIVEMEFSLVREDDRDLLFQQIYRESVQLGGSGPGSAVNAFDGAVHRILTRLIEDLDQQLPK